MRTKQRINPPITGSEKIVIRTHRELIVVPVDRIAYCEAASSYSKLMLIDGSIVLISKSLGFIEEWLGGNNFVRCHNSYLVNLRNIERFNRQLKEIRVIGQNIPVSRRKCCQTVMKLMDFYDHLQ